MAGAVVCAAVVASQVGYGASGTTASAPDARTRADVTRLEARRTTRPATAVALARGASLRAVRRAALTAHQTRLAAAVRHPGSTRAESLLAGTLVPAGVVPSGLARTADGAYDDPVGDGEGGRSPDIARVAIVDTADGTIGVGVRYANRTCVGAGDFLAVFVDTDLNAATGSSGFDAALALDGTLRQAALLRWDGTRFQIASATTLVAQCATEGFDVLVINRAELGVGSSFTFAVGASYTEGTTDYFDFAPDTGVWTYQLTGGTPPPPTPACSDALDNDGDGLVDYPADPGCQSPSDADETDAAPPPPPPPPPPPAKTFRSAAALPSSDSFGGTLSVKHRKLGVLVYRTMRALDAPRTLAFACWSADDWVDVLDSIGETPTDGDSVLLGFWSPRLPRWIHLSPRTCTNVQALLRSKLPNGPRADALVTALHETMHAYGIRNEAQANCFAVQLVELAGGFAGMTSKRAAYLGTVALRDTRAYAPSGYWNGARCHDGGAWDLSPNRTNLR